MISTKRSNRALAALVALPLALVGMSVGMPAQSAEAATYTVEQWNRVDVTVTSSTTYTHPDTDVSIAATFTGPGGSTITQPGFWDGGNTWKVRFAPTAIGEWTYVVTASDTANTGLNNVTGSIEATAYTGDLDIYKHGFVKTSSNGRAFSYDDGTPFFWLGDTHWQAANYERLDECNNPYVPSCTNEFQYSVDQVKAQGFTVYQTYPDAALNDGGGNVSQVNWWTDNYTHLNPQAFTDQFDAQMDYLADQGMVIALGMGVHSQNAQIGEAAMTQFTKYVTARYASYPIVWITGQEVDVENGLNTLPVWKAVAETIDATDGYNHPLSAHMNTVGEPKTFGDEPWHDWFATQGGHNVIRTQAHYKSYWDYLPTKPYLETEANYEGIYGGITTEAARQAAWKALQSGSFGFTYGGAGTWAMKWDYTVPGWNDYQNNIPWFDGLTLPGRTQMTIMKNFYESVGDWQSLTPRFGDAAYGTFANPEQAVLSTDGNASYVTYFYNASTVTGSLKGMDDAALYRASWFNPRTGTYSAISSSLTSTGGSWTIPAKPDKADWVLLVTSADPTAVTAAPLVTTQNLAYNKPAEASSHNETWLPEKAVDGHNATYWVAGAGTFPQSLQVDLGAAFSLSSVKQRFHDIDNSTYYYRVEGSNDESTWTVLADRTETGATGQTQTEQVAGTYRYVRLVVTGASNNHWASSDAFEVQGKNLALGRSATASSDNGANNDGHSYVAGQAFDGDPATNWVAAGGTLPQTLTVDLGVARALGLISQRFSNDATFSYDLAGSTDNATWTTLADRTATGRTFIENVTGTYRYVRLTITDATPGIWAASDELQVFGAELPMLAQIDSSSASTDGWYRGDVVANLSAVDDVEHSAVLEANIDSAGWTTITGPITLTGDGTHSVLGRVSNSDGTVSPVVEFTAGIDTAAPVTSSLAANRVVTLRGADATSGIARVEANVDGAGWTTYADAISIGDAGATVQYRGVDKAGNVESTNALVVPAVGVTLATSLTVAAIAGSSVRYADANSVNVRVSAATVPTGTVTVVADSVAIGSGTLSEGRVSIALASLLPGSHTLQVRYSGDASVASSSDTVVVKVAVATAAVKAAFVDATLTKSQKPKIKVTVASAAPIVGTVTVKEGSKVLKADVSLKNGKATITLPKLKKGTHKVVVSFGGSSTVGASKSSSVTVKVR